MNKNRVFITIFITGSVMPALLIIFLAYFGIAVMEFAFNIIPLTSGGTTNSYFLHNSILLNSTGIYLGIISGFLSSLSCIPIIKIKKYDSSDLAYLITYPTFAIGMIVIFGFIWKHDLTHAIPPFRTMSYWYFTTSIYYSISTVFFYVCSFLSFLLTLSLPVKYLLLQIKKQ